MPDPLDDVRGKDGRVSLGKADRAVKRAIKQRIRAGNEAAVVALVDLVNWKPEGSFPYDRDVYGKEVLDGDPEVDAEFFSEAFLYALIGKEDARTLLAKVGRVAKAFGFGGVRDLYRPEEDK